MEKHDHPTARQRLGDSAAGLGAAATLTRDDATAIRSGGQRRPVRLGWRARVGARACSAIVAGSRASTAPKPICRASAAAGRAGTAVSSPSASSSDSAQVVVLGTVAHEKLFGADIDPTGREVRIWNQPFTVVGVVASTNWATTGAVGDDQFDAVYVPLTTVHRLLNLTKLNSIT